MQTCKNCNKQFEITNDDRKFYKKIDVTEPTFCPACREQRRLVWRNEYRMYKRKCDRTGKEIISYISPDKKHTVYSLEEWFKDDWEARDYGRPYDFKKPFFEQFAELLKVTPHISLLIGECENCLYANFSWKNKNGYLLYAADYNEDCFYSGYLFTSKDCVDCFFVNESELCYECVDCERCYDTNYSQQCKDCANCSYCYECIGCKNCIGCINLRRQEYCIFNKQLSKEEYKAQAKAQAEKLNKVEIEKEFSKFQLKHPRKAVNETKCEDCLGNNLAGCKNCKNCFDLISSEDCTYVTYGIKSKDCMDINGSPEDELCYECVACPQCYNVHFASSCWVKSSNLTYCYLCRASHDCFGCMSLHRNKYCILNKQYSEEEYEKLLPRVINHMKKTGEWGEFFPMWVSPWDYEETVAKDYFPR